MSAARLKANLQAKEFVANLRSGVVINGIVRSVDHSTNMRWIAIELPGMEERRINVKDAANLHPGDIVSLQCVPNPVRAGCYLFRVVSPPTQPLLDKYWTFWRRHVVRLRCTHR